MGLALILVVPLIVAALIIGLMVLRRHRAPTGPWSVPTFDGDIAHTFDPEHSVTLRGGGRFSGVSMTWPFVTLTIDRAYVHIGGFWNAWLPHEDLKVALVSEIGPFGSSIQFHTKSGKLDGFRFAPRGREVSNALARFGW